jgi:hypothetical protein
LLARVAAGIYTPPGRMASGEASSLPASRIDEVHGSEQRATNEALAVIARSNDGAPSTLEQQHAAR